MSQQPPASGAASGPPQLPVKPRRLQHTLLHTRLSLDFSSVLLSPLPTSAPPPSIVGHAELIYQALTDKLRYVTFCCRGYVVESVSVDGVPASFSLVNSSLFTSSASALQDVRDVRCVEHVWDDEMDCLNSGNVWVKVPSRVKAGMKEREKAKRSAHEDIDITGDSQKEDDRPVPIVLSVHFRIDPAACRGLEWWTKGRGYGAEGVKGEDVCLTVTSLGDASLWMPCMDVPSERGSYEVDLVVPAHLQAVASGRLKERRYEDKQRSLVRFSFVQDRPVPSRCMGWALGRFMMDVDERLDWTSYFFPASVHAAFTYTITQPSTVSSVVRLFEPYLDSFPYPHLHLVFASIRRPEVYAGLLLLPVDWLTEAAQIDPVYINRRHLAHQLALCWMTALVVESPSDDWIGVGLSGLLQLLFVENVFGHSEAEHLALTWSCEVVREDGEDRGLNDLVVVANTTKLLTEPMCPFPPLNPKLHHLPSTERMNDSRPLCWNGYTHPSDLVTRSSRRKAAIVMRMLHAKTGPDAFQHITHRMMDDHSERSVASSAVEGESGGGGAEGGAVVLPLSTARFSELVKEESADVDLSSFFNQWLFCDSYPFIQLWTDYSAKKKNTVVEVEQLQCRYLQGLKFEGPMKFVIHEAERVTEQERRVEAAKHEFEFSCVSRVRRNRKRKHYDKEALLQLPLEKLLTRHNDTPVLWVRCDVLHAFFQPIDVIANEVMLCSQLQGEKEVRGQLEAICALWRLFLNPDGYDVEEDRFRQLIVESVEAEGLHLGVNALKDAFNDGRFFYRVRLLAARVLARSSARDASDSSQRQALEEWLREQFSDTETGEWRANDFTAVADYQLKKGLALELSRSYVRLNGEDLSPGRIVRLLLSLLTENDNERNPYSDDHYIAHLLLALGNLRLARTEEQTRVSIVAALQRHLAHDQVLPSYQRVVTQAALTAAVVLQLSHQLHEPLLPYSDFLDPTYPAAVRVTAFRCVLLLCNDTRHHGRHLRHLLDVLSERDGYVQQLQLQCWCQLIGERAVSLHWLRSPTSSAAVQLSDALWAAMLATSSAPYGYLPGCRHWLLRLYQLCFGRKLSEVATAAQKSLSAVMQKAIAAAAEQRWEEKVGEGGGVEWRSTTARKYFAQQQQQTQRVRRETVGGHQSNKTGKIRLSKASKGGEYKARETFVVDAADEDDEEWRGRD